MKKVKFEGSESLTKEATKKGKKSITTTPLFNRIGMHLYLVSINFPYLDVNEAEKNWKVNFYQYGSNPSAF